MVVKRIGCLASHDVNQSGRLNHRHMHFYQKFHPCMVRRIHRKSRVAYKSVTLSAFPKPFNQFTMTAHLRILCFGDSLTEGYSQYGTRFDPYSRTMKRVLEEKLKGQEIEVLTDGQSGDLVTAGSFKGRVGRRYEQQSTRRPLYDWVILLGGTNDLGWGKPVFDIHDALTAVSDIPLENGAKVLMCTVPECGAKSEDLDQKRNSLNAFIKSDMRDEVYIFDLKEKIPYHSMDEEERKLIWDDGLHLTSKGYERMGEMIAERLVEIIEAEKTGGGATDSTAG